MVMVAFLIIPQLVSGGITGSTVITGNVVHPPIARFVADTTRGSAPLAVTFTDLSESDPASWFWEFGDGTNSVTQNPNHTYAVGVYTVNLTVTNAAGFSRQSVGSYITALPVPAPPSQLTPLSVYRGGGNNGGSDTYTEAGIPGSNSKNPQSPSWVPSPQLAPPEMGQASRTIDLFPYGRFIYSNSSGRPFAIIDRVETGRAGAGVLVNGTTVAITHPDFVLSITATTITEANGIVRADDIRSILLAVTPLKANIRGTGPVTTSFTIDLLQFPQNAQLTATIGEPVTSVKAEAFRSAVFRECDDIQAFAYNLTVQGTNISASRPATITMSLPAGWVSAHGGTGNVVIGMMSGDQNATILNTSFAGYDMSGNMVFVADSPEGVGAFGLIATREPLQARTGTAPCMTLPYQNPFLSMKTGISYGTMNVLAGFSFVILIILIILLLILYMGPLLQLMLH
jgi:PKD repeat protein